ncbi:MAG: hypothetical protein GX804_00960 [Lentisphaerae bacterium]|jgi:hypothetical protein|nr:hypothetical protein [Lentisphaerota bacterium]
MKAYKLVTVLLRLMGLYIFMQFLIALPSSLGGMIAVNFVPVSETGNSAPHFLTLLRFLYWMSFIRLVVSVGLFFYAPKLSHFIVRNQDDFVILPERAADGVQTWVYRLFGVYAIITWGPEIVQTLCQTIIYGTWQPDVVPFLKRFYENWSELIGPAVGVVLGLLLIFKAGGLVRLIQLSRPMSRQRTELETMKEEHER